MRQKDKVIDSLINQFFQQNSYLFQKNYADSHWRYTEDTGERENEKKSETTSSHTENIEQDISHEIEPSNTSNSQENIENNDNEREENVTLQNQEISPEKSISQSSTEKHCSHDTRANNCQRSGNKKSVVILDDSMS